MKIELYCNSGANIHSCRKEILDLEKDYGINDEEWAEMSDDEKYNMAEEWAFERLEIGYKEI